jgi:hypothetical protein
MIEVFCSFHKGNKNERCKPYIKWFEWEFGEIIKYTYTSLPIGPTIRSLKSHWVVMTFHHCYLWLRLRLDTLWVIIVSYDYTPFHVNLKLLLWIFLNFSRDMWLTLFFNSSSFFFLHLGVGFLHFLVIDMFWYLKSS